MEGGEQKKHISPVNSQEQRSGSTCINRAEIGVIEGYVASAHHILAAKLVQMC